jgi:hypothetical protein
VLSGHVTRTNAPFVFDASSLVGTFRKLCSSGNKNINVSKFSKNPMDNCVHHDHTTLHQLVSCHITSCFMSRTRLNCYAVNALDFHFAFQIPFVIHSAIQFDITSFGPGNDIEHILPCGELSLMDAC